ncbi:MAG: hypothetical protein HYS27_24110 [Deltaproteobacteria bacterium]|nr:hypothetical protein [Deltaproteobacteria bacterium]
MDNGRDPIEVDEGVLEKLLAALLEAAARKDALRAWPREQPPERDPPVQARRDADGTLGVFRFFTIVANDPDPTRQLTVEEARARIEGLDDSLQAGDEVGVELPLGRLAAIALADVDAVAAGLVQLLPPRIVEMLGDAALAKAVTARLSSLRGPPPHVPLRRLVTDYGGDAVLWTAVAADPGELMLLIARGDDHRLVVVPCATSAAGYAALLRALAPAPPERSLWRFLEAEGAALLCGPEGAVWSEPGAAGSGDDPAFQRRLSLEVKSIAIARDATVYGVARARARLLTWVGNGIVDDREATVGLPVDLPRLFATPWPDDDARTRLEQAAVAFRGRVQARLSALLSAREPAVEDVLGGAALLRVLARAAQPVGSVLASTEAEPLVIREADGADDELCVRVVDLGVLVLSPADDVVAVRTGARDLELFADGALVDGDAEAWTQIADALGRAIADSDQDLELAFDPSDQAGDETGDEDGGQDDAETVLLSAWLAGLGERERGTLRWPPRATGAESAAMLHAMVDRFVDPGPPLAPDGDGRTDPRRRS